MDNRINIVSEIHFSRLEDITNFQDNFNGTVQISTSEWKKLPIYEGSARMSVQQAKTTAGSLTTTNITGRLKSRIVVKCQGILSVKMCDGKIFILGTPDLPVNIDLTITLTQKTFQINHQNTVFPYVKAV